MRHHQSAEGDKNHQKPLYQLLVAIYSRDINRETEVKGMKKFKGIFKNANYVKLFFANFTSQMGSTIGLTAFMFYLLDRFSEQPFYATLTELMFSVPTLAVFFLVGVFADRMDRQKIAYHCDWISALLSI
ncbi:hypothetical protein VL14_23380, partial [Cytobacillus firmus]